MSFSIEFLYSIPYLRKLLFPDGITDEKGLTTVNYDETQISELLRENVFNNKKINDIINPRILYFHEFITNFYDLFETSLTSISTNIINPHDAHFIKQLDDYIRFYNFAAIESTINSPKIFKLAAKCIEILDKNNQKLKSVDTNSDIIVEFLYLLPFKILKKYDSFINVIDRYIILVFIKYKCPFVANTSYSFFKEIITFYKKIIQNKQNYNISIIQEYDDLICIELKEFNKIICRINNDQWEYWCICRLLNMFVEKNNLDVIKLVANELKNYSDKKSILKAYSQNNN